MVQSLCPGANVITVPRDSLAGFDRVRSEVLNDLQNALGHAYDWVVRTDADELICFDPNVFTSFEDVLSKCDAMALFALGLNIVEMSGDEVLDGSEPALSKRSNVAFSGHYSKAWAVHDQVALERHGVRVEPDKASKFDFVMPQGIYLAHLKYANRAATLTANAERANIARGEERGLPGNAWRFAEKRAEACYQEMSGKPLIEWEAGRAKVFDSLKTPVRNTKDGLIRARSFRFNFRTVLPDWFKDC
jgi:hypothetical protein